MLPAIKAITLLLYYRTLKYDPDKPFMDGSDDDFSDLEGELDDDNDEDTDTDTGTPATSHSPPPTSPATTPPPGNTRSTTYSTSYVDHKPATSQHHTFSVSCWSNCPCTRLSTGTPFYCPFDRSDCG